eukprot:scaffold1717_cov117-Cylindrotheca_fusiformis.AAC.2
MEKIDAILKRPARSSSFASCCQKAWFHVMHALNDDAWNGIRPANKDCHSKLSVPGLLMLLLTEDSLEP